MLLRSTRKNLWWAQIAIAIWSLSACGQAPQTLLPGQFEPKSVPADATQKQAARALSVGNVAMIAPSADPFQRALACAVAVETLAARLEKSQMLDEAQNAAVKRAARFYAQQSIALAPTSAAAHDYDKVKRQEEIRQRESRLSAQTAIGCLRNAAETMGQATAQS